MSTFYVPNTTRPHWGGAASDVDQHIEQYDGIRDTQFEYMSIFRSLSSQRSVQNNSNNYRFDRLNSSKVLGRGAGEDIVAQKVTSDKVNIIVEMMLYIRNPIDYMDDWTAPDYLGDMGRNNGTQFAKTYDEAHVIRLIKARDYEAPAHLKPAFGDGISIDVTIKGGTSLTADEMSANASALYTALGKVVTEMTKRDVPMNDMVCLVSPDRFADLLEHPRLLNKDYMTDGGSYAQRRIVMVQGLQVMESTAFPTEVETDHPLSTATNGNAFNVTAEDLKAQLIIFSKGLSLITVTAKEFTSTFWDDKRAMTNVLDCYTMYTVDTRRPDTIGVVLVTEETTP